MKITAGLLFSWLVSGLTILLGLTFLPYSIIGGLLMILTGIFVLPRTRRKIKEKYDVEFSRWVVVIVAVLGIFLAIGFTPLPVDDEEPTNVNETEPNGSETEDINWTEDAQELDYDSLLRNEEEHLGEPTRFEGQITQVTEETDEMYSLRINTKEPEFGDGYTEEDVYLEYEGERLLKDDIVEVKGTYEGTHSYSTVLGSQRTIPEFDPHEIDVLE